MPESPSPLRQAYRFFRWIILLVLVLVIVVALRKPAPPAAALPPENAQEKLADFNSKLDELAAAHARGEAGEARFSGDEINSAVASSMAQPQAAAAPESSELPVKTVEVAFVADQVIGQFTTQIYGKEVYITLAGRLGSHDGYATFEPSEFKVGQLSMPLALVNDTLQKKLAEPANHEKLKLPEYISSLLVEDGQ